MKSCPNYLAVLFFMLTFNQSCVKNVDFNQPTNINVTPVFQAPVLFFQEPASTFRTDTGVEEVTIEDEFEADIFADEFSKENLVRALLFFKVTNSINRAFELQIELLDQNDMLQHEFKIEVPASPSNTAIVTEHTETFEGSSLSALKNTFKFKFSVTLKRSSDGSVITNSSLGEIDLQSSATFFLDVDL